MDNSIPLRDQTGKLITQFRTEGPAPVPSSEETAPDLTPAIGEAAARALSGDLLRSVLGTHRSKPPAPKVCSAVFVAHGMGQQIPFQTLDAVVEGLRREDLSYRQQQGQRCKDVNDLPKPRTNTIQHGDDRLQRVELSISDAGGQERDVHVYEGYWAPLVEGNVTLRDVMGFFWRGGSNGISNGAQPFQRWIFGKYRDFGVTGRTVRHLSTALLVLLSLAMMNFTLVTVAATRSPLGPQVSWLSNSLFADLTTVFNLALTGMLALVLPLLAGKGLQGTPTQKGPIIRLSWLGFWIALASIVAAGVAIPILFYLHIQWVREQSAGVSPVFLRNWPGGWLVQRFDLGLELALTFAVVLALLWGVLKLYRSLWPHPSPQRSQGAKASGKLLVAAAAGGALVIILGWAFSGIVLSGSWPWLPTALGGVSWCLLVLASAKIRTLMIEYPGDVAVYVSPQILDRFDELRREIRNCVYKQAAAVYGLKEDGRFAYDRILVVGHSLGSVVVYDTLNRLIVEDELSKQAMRHDPGAGKEFLNVLGRTKLLLTFGSPLDKTAFLFSLQGNHTSETREALAAEVQPMIQHAGFRPFPWINVWSPQDIISGHLDFYDPPPNQVAANTPLPQAVVNVEDRDATTVLAAHVEYWHNPTVFQQLHGPLIEPR
jgi:hypothetical protein